MAHDIEAIDYNGLPKKQSKSNSALIDLLYFGGSR